ncbi:hypothetical protein K469DRAFT_750706 [Zopfia rhizophila CBS 207.26]|uniref:Uncharacterized protein n=1 Tax=Zopfia rhizophila CBS 207.26 TaxID=1314779 RepID=A0A6A6E2B2_9PEZI|nr:hypothetical protein K469DRAFT_750706 [Zopfia rhizophila CBS 207.26]
MSEVDARFIKRGLWTQLNEGPITGKTVTAEVQAGTIVVALLAVLASMGTAHLWNLVAFILHQLRADGIPADGLFRQQQALLRTLPTPSSLLADSTKLWLFWRKRVDRAFVLVDSPFCGPLNIDPTVEDYVTNVYGLRTLEAKVAAISKSYADDCYRTDSPLPTRCRIFTRPNIPFTEERVACPFASSMCTDAELPAIRFDSGLVGLNEGFGLNLASKDRVKFRRQTTCAVLETAAHSTIVNATDYPDMDHTPFPGEQLLIMHYGDIVYDTSWPNATFVHSLAVSNITNFYQTNYNMAYGNPAWVDMNDFDPVPEMKSADRDLVIVMLWKNSMGYGSPVNDLFFSAHDASLVGTLRGTNETWYLSDSPGSAMGCTQQYQFCFARDGSADHCTDLAALPGKVTAVDYPGASDIQLAAIQLLITSSLLFDISDAGQDVLKAKDLAGGTGFILLLLDDQWIQEVTRWESFVWAALQTAVSDYAIGPAVRGPSAGAYIRNDTSNGEKELCHVQRVRKSGGFVTINAFGLALITVFSILVATLDFMLLRFLITLSRFRRAMAPKLHRWIQDGVFQLQRRAYEARGEGSWQHTDKEIPVTLGNERLEDLPVLSVSGLPHEVLGDRYDGGGGQIREQGVRALRTVG